MNRLPQLITRLRPLSCRPSSASSLLKQLPTTSSTSTRTFTSTTTRKMSSSTPVTANAVLDLIKNRRTYYPLSKDLTVSKERIQEIVNESVLHVPSSFNSQTNRVVVLFGEEHNKLWDITEEVLKTVVPPESFEPTKQKIAMFRAAAGSVLFFEDQSIVESMQEKFPLYADKFPIWATQSDAMLQFTVWTALEAEGLGANLQHYNPIIDSKVAEAWKTPSNWRLNAQLVFGGRTGEAGPKTQLPIEERVKVFGA